MTKATADLSSVPKWNIHEVRCRSGQLCDRLLVPAEFEVPHGQFPWSEIFCRKCRQILLEGPLRDLDRHQVIVLHYVHTARAEVVDTRIIVKPVRGDRSLNRGGQRLSAEVLDKAIEEAKARGSGLVQR